MWARSRKGLQLLKELKTKSEDNFTSDDSNHNTSTDSSSYDSGIDSPQVVDHSIHKSIVNHKSNANRLRSVEIRSVNGRSYHTNNKGDSLPWISRPISDTLRTLDHRKVGPQMDAKNIDKSCLKEPESDVKNGELFHEEITRDLDTVMDLTPTAPRSGRISTKIAIKRVVINDLINE